MNLKIPANIAKTIFGAAFCLGATAVLAATSNSVVTVSVDLSSQVTGGTFTPGTDTVAVRGTFNGWSQYFLTNSGGNVYSGAFTNTSDPNGGQMLYKFWNSNAATPNGGWESTANNHNRSALLPANSGDHLILPTAFFSDAGAPELDNLTFQVDMAQQINKGVFDTNVNTVEVRGSFQGWSGGYTLTADPTILRTNSAGLVTSNVYVGTFPASGSPGQNVDFKFVIQPGSTWESPDAIHANEGGNRFLDLVNNFTNPVVDFSDQPYSLLTATNVVRFQVDMTYLNGGLFDPALDTVELRGNFNNWSGNVNICTNDPSGSNTNLYTTYVTITDSVGAIQQFKFVYTGGNVPKGISWEQPAWPTMGGNRFFALPNSTATNLPAVYFSDLTGTELLPGNADVTFTVDMTGAMTTDGHAFDPTADSVFMNGDFLGWLNWSASNLANYQLTNNPVGSSNYSLTLPFLKGSPLNPTYKFSVNGTDNEAPSSQNHYRYIRTVGTYTMPIDKFGSQYGEISFGNLTAGAASRGYVPISWLGRPAVHLQVATNVGPSAIWTDLLNTDGGNWSQANGYTATNGFFSVTNYPTGGAKTFFRLVKPAK